MELNNYLLISLPNNPHLLFDRAVIYVTQHDRFGAEGLIINHPTHSRVGDILTHMHLFQTPLLDNPTVLDGGPFETESGFVLHTPVDHWQTTIQTGPRIALTSSQDILMAIACNEPPPLYLLTLGHCRWFGDQLEKEIRANQWLVAPATRELLFHTPYSERYKKALRLAGVKTSISLTEFVGHA